MATRHQIVDTPSVAVLDAEIRRRYAIVVGREYSDVLSPTLGDGLSFLTEVVAGYINELLEAANVQANDVIPGPNSPYVDDQVALVGVTRRGGESDESLWGRRDDRLSGVSRVSLPARRRQVFGVPGVVDVTFDYQLDGSFLVYIVSSLDPPDAQLEGIPTLELREAVEASLNAEDSADIDQPFHARAPSALAYGVYLEVHHVAEDLVALEDQLRAVGLAFARAHRRLGGVVTQSHLYAAFSGVEHVMWVDGDLRVGNATHEQLTPADDATFYTCAAVVNFVGSVGEAKAGQVNIRLVEAK